VPKHEHQHLTTEELRVLTLREWAALNSLSFGTAKRLFAEGKGPKTVQLSARRVGVRMIDARRWQEARVRS
jgi:predicted DNA-binding transcriptional regulator AlpA